MTVFGLFIPKLDFFVLLYFFFLGWVGIFKGEYAMGFLAFIQIANTLSWIYWKNIANGWKGLYKDLRRQLEDAAEEARQSKLKAFKGGD